MNKGITEREFNDTGSNHKALPDWNKLPEHPITWKESDFAIFAEMSGGDEFLFQYRNDTYSSTDRRDHVLSSSGHLERITPVVGEKALKRRIQNILDQDGIPDESVKALEALHALKAKNLPKLESS